MSPEVKAALRRLFMIARTDTGGGGRVARFLLAWWNAGQHGGFDLTDFWSMDEPILRDCLLVLDHVVKHPGEYYEDELRLYFEDVIAVWGKKRRRASR